MRYLNFFLISLIFFACQNKDNAPVTTSEVANFSIQTTENADLNHENLRLYPIHASADFIAAQSSLAELKSLEEAIENNRFRISEKKPFGRFEDAGAVNSLTTQNKSDETIFIMSGDILQGGNQDRMIAHDLIVAPNTITDVAVFCVEQGRWNPKKDTNKKEVYAFKGYYNVASNDLRRTMKNTNNQQAVWDKVSEITTAQDAESETGAYTMLESSSKFTDVRETYLNFFKHKFSNAPTAIGMVAVSGSKILGVDIFGHPNIFQSKYESLLHSYITEAVNEGSPANMDKQGIEKLEKKLTKAAFQANEENAFKYQDKLVHFTEL